MIGDKVEDVLFGINIGATPILVRTGFGASAETALHEMRITPAAVTGNLLDAVNWLLGRDSAQP
jgi:D-glycero-D-manno-heptose 1,7-bisphosphate phosphatase